MNEEIPKYYNIISSVSYFSNKWKVWNKADQTSKKLINVRVQIKVKALFFPKTEKRSGKVGTGAQSIICRQGILINKVRN